MKSSGKEAGPGLTSCESRDVDPFVVRAADIPVRVGWRSTVGGSESERRKTYAHSGNKGSLVAQQGHIQEKGGHAQFDTQGGGVSWRQGADAGFLKGSVQEAPGDGNRFCVSDLRTVYSQAGTRLEEIDRYICKRVYCSRGQGCSMFSRHCLHPRQLSEIDVQRVAHHATENSRKGALQTSYTPPPVRRTVTLNLFSYVVLLVFQRHNKLVEPAKAWRQPTKRIFPSENTSP